MKGREMASLAASSGTERNDGTQGNPADKEHGAINIAALRSDFVSVRAFFLECGEWNADQAADIANDISASAKSDDMGMLAFWCAWFARWADIARMHAAQMQRIQHAVALYAVELVKKAA
jgi:hypothetical protein